MSRPPIFFGLALLVFSAFAATAGASAITGETPAVAGRRPILPDGSVVYGESGGWRMVAAPTNSPRETLTLYTFAPANHGQISLVCRRDGGLDGDIAIIPNAAMGLPAGAIADIQLSVDGETHEVAMTAVRGGLVSSGPGVLAMMSRLGELSPSVGDTISATYKGRQIMSVAVPANHIVISNASGICLDWLRQERIQASR